MNRSTTHPGWCLLWKTGTNPAAAGKNKNTEYDGGKSRARY